MQCLDCDQPSVTARRCADCFEEVSETPNWLPPPPPIDRGRPRAQKIAPYGSKIGSCASCGKTIWRGSSSLPPGEATCLECRRAAKPTCSECGGPVSRRSQMCRACWTAAKPERRTCSVPDCDKTHDARGLCNRHYLERYGDLERRRARWRARNHRRRVVGREGDVTAEYEYLLRAKAKRCPMPGCNVRMVDQPYQPTSKELDHIIPINVGGTHTIGNVRIICRLCNLRRPDDGSDYTGPVTLWAEVA